MQLTDQPVRVIYAKLTSTGAYDVVAKTANVPLDRARALAEKLLPGNPPLDAVVGEEVAHVQPPEGGHIVMRFARYDWNDGDRGDVFITDILWLSDDDFGRVRANAFALVPRTDQIFAELTDLPPVTLGERTVAMDLERVAQLSDVAPEAKTVIASTAAAESVLLVHSGARARAMELFTLLLPPRMRASLTFQTQAFRVPSVMPRVTLVDRSYANLRTAAWQILPSVDVDVPLELAGRLVALADNPTSLGLAHELYDDAYSDTTDLRTGITRLTRLAATADMLRNNDALGALRLLASAPAPERAAALRRLRASVDAVTLRRALVLLLQDGGDASSHVLPLLHEIDDEAGSAETTAALTDALNGTAPDELVVELAGRAARHGDVPRLITLLSPNPRTLAARVSLDDTRVADDVRRLVLAIRDAFSARADFEAVARLLAAAHAVHRSLPAASAAVLHRMCRTAVTDALEHTSATTTAVAGLRRLQDAAAAYAATVGAAAPLPALLAPHELATPEAADAATRLAADYPEPASAVLGAALLTRAWGAHQAGNESECRRATGCAVTMLSRAHGVGRELARQVLAERNVQEHELLGMPGAETLLPILGGNALQAAVTRRIVTAITALAAGQEAGLPELTSAVYAAHQQQTRIRANSELSQRVVVALRELALSQKTRADTAAVEICLELLGIITEATHIDTLEDAVLGDGVVVRLRRLDRSVAHCRAAEDEDRYERYARALESADVPVDSAARERLRDALGTGGLKRRLLRAVSSVVERDAS